MRVAVHQLLHAQADVGLLAVVAVRRVEVAIELVEAAVDPLAVGPAAADVALDLAVVEEGAARCVDGDHLARPDPAGLDDLAERQVHEADLGAHHDQAVARDLVAGGSEPIAVHDRGGDAAVGEGHGGGAVPRLLEAGVVLVEGPQLGVHVGHVLPGLWDQHHHRVQQIAARDREQLERLVERGGVGAYRPDRREELLDLVAPDGRGQLRLARLHPVAVAEQRVDLAVVRDVAERLRERPVRQRVRREALVEERDRGDRALVREVRVEARQLRRDHQPLVDDRARRHRDDVAVELALAERTLGAAPRQVEPALELGAVEALRPAQQQLLDAGQRVQRETAQDRRVVRHGAPADGLDAEALGRVLEHGARRGAGVLVLRQEAHRDRELLAVGELVAEARRVVAQQLERDLDRDARTVAGRRVRGDGAAVREVDDGLDGELDDAARALAADLGDEAGAAGVVILRGVVEPARRMQKSRRRKARVSGVHRSVPPVMVVRPVGEEPQCRPIIAHGSGALTGPPFCASLHKL